MTKFGVNGFTEALRQEVTKRHVRVGVLEPGGVTTELGSPNTGTVREEIDTFYATTETLVLCTSQLGYARVSHAGSLVIAAADTSACPCRGLSRSAGTWGELGPRMPRKSAAAGCQRRRPSVVQDRRRPGLGKVAKAVLTASAAGSLESPSGAAFEVVRAPVGGR